MNLGQKLRSARDALGLSRSDVARKIGVTPQTIYLWETGRSQPLRKYIHALAATLHLPRGELLIGELPADAPVSVEGLMEELRGAVAFRHGVGVDQISVNVAIAISTDKV